MIVLCERCLAPVGDGESVVRYAHIDQAHHDGKITWLYTYVHIGVCVPPRAASHERPDTGAWDPGRGIGAYRA